ncbi:unnamed protein product [Thelazia callipaeda]|uniref:Uncharacterized protein n=1 Tax=Thelazia callipaeda TaxID=103827 RepID=A0A0N5CQM6_THECL|nr:unnamed protein product [Thelazia callipaeda]
MSVESTQPSMTENSIIDDNDRTGETAIEMPSCSEESKNMVQKPVQEEQQACTAHHSSEDKQFEKNKLSNSQLIRNEGKVEGINDSLRKSQRSEGNKEMSQANKTCIEIEGMIPEKDYKAQNTKKKELANAQAINSESMQKRDLLNLDKPDQMHVDKVFKDQEMEHPELAPAVN